MDSEMSIPSLVSTTLLHLLNGHWGAVTLKRKQLECEVTTHLHLILRLSGAIPLLPHMPAWNAQG
jgi:hypothetical protein